MSHYEHTVAYIALKTSAALPCVKVRATELQASTKMCTERLLNTCPRCGKAKVQTNLCGMCDGTISFDYYQGSAELCDTCESSTKPKEGDSVALKQQTS